MSARSLGGLVAVSVLFALCATSARGDEACWKLLYSTVQHNAAVPHAPFVSYSESVDLQEDGIPIQSARANVTYRDDGVAYIDDSRFDHPFLSGVLDPGPPILGPYGTRRETWLEFGNHDAPLPIIADAQTAHREECKDLGDDMIDGGKFAHLVFPGARDDGPALKSVWIDRTRLTVRRAVVSEYINFYFYDGDITHHLADFTLEVRQIDGHDVLDQLNWHYSYWQYGQRTNLNEEYRFGAYQFNSQAPAGTLFASAGGS
jgi:hypothetical protein